MNNRQETNNTLHKTFQFDTFRQAIDRMVYCADQIDENNHHPEWTNVYNRVEVQLRTHDAGNIVTEKDHQLAKLLDEKFETFSGK